MNNSSSPSSGYGGTRADVVLVEFCSSIVVRVDSVLVDVNVLRSVVASRLTFTEVADSINDVS